MAPALILPPNGGLLKYIFAQLSLDSGWIDRPGLKLTRPYTTMRVYVHGQRIQIVATDSIAAHRKTKSRNTSATSAPPPLEPPWAFIGLRHSVGSWSTLSGRLRAYPLVVTAPYLSGRFVVDRGERVLPSHQSNNARAGHTHALHSR